jgi:integrase
VPGFGVRVTDKGKRTYVLVARFPGSKHPTRRAIASVEALSLEKARAKARDWLELISKGIDPSEQERQRSEQEEKKRKLNFGTVIEDYLTHIKGQRRAKAAEREIRTEILPAWRTKPITEINRDDVVKLVKAIAARPAPYHAHNIFGHIRTFFNWCIEGSSYGLERSPCDRLKPSKLIGEKKPRKRVLSDDELFAFWRATERMRYPYGPCFRVLLLTGQRKSEVSDAQWCEFDRKARVWTVPPERFKSDAQHLVPLSDDAGAILKRSRGRRGNFFFRPPSEKSPSMDFPKQRCNSMSGCAVR